MNKATNRAVLNLTIALTALFARLPSATAQEVVSTQVTGLENAATPMCTETADCCRRWAFRVIPYLWAPGFDGDITVRRTTAPVDVSIGRILDILFTDLNVAALGQFEASNGRLGVIFDGIYVDVSPGKEIRRIEFSSRLRITILDLAATWEFPAIPELLHLPADSRFELLAGARFDSLSAHITATGPRGDTASAGGTEDWFDPIIGARLRVPLRNCWTAQVRGDIGGFDIGEASQFTWNIEATLEYRWSPRCSLLAGYRWLNFDHHSGSGLRRFDMDLTLSGPLMGIALDF